MTNTSNDPRVMLPKGFVETKYPGYYWNHYDKQLYSLKSGILQPLKKIKPNRWNKAPPEMGAFYAVSHRGERRFLSVRDLCKLELNSSEVPTAWPITMKTAIAWHNQWFTEGNGQRLGQFLINRLRATCPEVFYERDNETAWVEFCDKFVRE